MLVYANDRMDNLISIAPSLLSAYLKNAGHEVELYDTTFIDEGKESGDEFRIATLQLKPARLSDEGLFRKKMTTKEMQQNFREAIRKFKPDLIGFSSLEITYDQTSRLIEGIKDLPIPIIVGGMYPTFAPKMVLENPIVDMICEGEGELPLVELANKLAKVNDVAELFKISKIMDAPGGEERIVRKFNPPEEVIKTLNISMRVDGDTFYRSGFKVDLEEFGNGDYLESKKVGLQRPDIDLNRLLTPDYSIYEPKRFRKPMGGKIFNAITVETARGCPFGCGFCCIPQQQAHCKAAEELREKVRQEKEGLAFDLLKNADGPETGHHKQKSPWKIVAEIKEAVKQYKVNFLYFSDETFLAKPAWWLEAFFKEYDTVRLPPGSLPESFTQANTRFVRDDGTERLPFFISTRVETVAGANNKRYAKELEKIGCANVALGLESGNPEYRAKFLKRMMPNSTIVKGFKSFEETEVRISANNIIGFPHETRDDIFKTIEINRIVNADSIIVNAFRPYTGTPLREECIKMGLISPGTRAEDNRALDQFYNGVMDAKEIEGLRRTFVLYTTFPKERWAEIKLAEQDDGAFEKLSKEFHDGNFLERKCRVNRYDHTEVAQEAVAVAGVEVSDPQ